MRSCIITFLLVIVFFNARCQCTCSEQFAFVKQQITSNYAGYKDKVMLYGKTNYDALTARTTALVKEDIPPAYCFAAMKEWLNFFKDGHVQLYSEDVNHRDSASLRRRIEACEVISLSPAALKALEQSKGIEGVYRMYDSTYTIAIIKNQNKFRDYVGVIVDSRADTWKPGQVKLEMKKDNDTTYKTLLYMRDHTCALERYNCPKNGLKDYEWIRVGTTPPAGTQDEATPESPVNIRKLSEKTLYLQILTFHGSYAKLIDSVVKANESLLSSMPNLVLDIRNNGGGSDFSYKPLLPYIYTGPVVSDGVDVWATKDNITSWKTGVLDNPDVPESTKAEVRELIDSMQRHIGRFVESAADDTTVVENASAYPLRVVLLTNTGCASSAEQFILFAKHSKRVTIMGQPSHGVIDYANVRSIASPCKEISVLYATTRSRRVQRGRPIDNVGIKPDILLPDNKDLIEEARKYLEK